MQQNNIARQPTNQKKDILRPMKIWHMKGKTLQFKNLRILMYEYIRYSVYIFGEYPSEMLGIITAVLGIWRLTRTKVRSEYASFRPLREIKLYMQYEYEDT